MLPFTMLFNLEDYAIQQLPQDAQLPVEVASTVVGTGKVKVAAKGLKKAWKGLWKMGKHKTEQKWKNQMEKRSTLQFGQSGRCPSFGGKPV